MPQRPHRLGPAVSQIARSSRTLLAASLTAGTVLAVVAPVANAQGPATAESFVADLAKSVADAQRGVNDAQNALGGVRERANKARVDLVEARRKAQQAQAGVIDARGKLTSADKQVSEAQKKLDSIATSAYSNGGDPAPIAIAAGGGSAVADNLDRATYIRLAAERQRAVVDRLDLARTQIANRESALRSGRAQADAALRTAAEVHNAAAQALQETQSRLAQQKAALDKAQVELRKAEAKLKAARAAIQAAASKNPDASSFDRRRAAEQAADKAAASIPAAPAAPKEKEEASSAGAPAAGSDAAAAGSSTPATGSTEPGAGSGAPAAGSSSSDSGSAPALPPVPSLPPVEVPSGDFSSSAAGDSQRQQAINGLVNAGNAAALAGFASVAQNGDPAVAAGAAVSAGRQAAAREFDNAMGTNGGAANATPNPGAPADAPDTAAPAPGPVDAAVGLLPGVDPQPPQNPNAVDTVQDASGSDQEKIERVIQRARGQLGMPYAWGGGNYDGPTLGIRDGGVADSFGDYNKIGFDCSGLVMYAYAGAGIYLQHYSGYQYTAGRQIPASEAQRGDLLFWGDGGSEHVAISLGDGTMIEAPQSGSFVTISPIRYGGMAPYAVRLIG